MFKRILVANRGEIALRIIRACRELGIETVAVHSDADAAAIHVREADRSVRIGPPPATESHLRVEQTHAAAPPPGPAGLLPGGAGARQPAPGVPQAAWRRGLGGAPRPASAGAVGAAPRGRRR